MRTTRQATAGGAGQDHRQGGFHLADLVGVLWARGPMFPKTAQDKCAQSLVRGEVLKRTGLHQEDFDQYASRGAGPDRAFAAWVAANLTAEGLAESGELTPEVDGDDDGLPHVAAALAKLHDEGLTAKLLAELWQRWPAVAEARGLPRAEQVRSAPPGGGGQVDAAKADARDVAPLSEIDALILKKLAEYKHAVRCVDLPDWHRSTVAAGFKRLCARGFASWPKRSRKGACITEAGRAYLTDTTPT